jgi:hypothetical protein
LYICKRGSSWRQQLRGCLWSPGMSTCIRTAPSLLNSDFRACPRVVARIHMVLSLLYPALRSCSCVWCCSIHIPISWHVLTCATAAAVFAVFMCLSQMASTVPINVGYDDFSLRSQT